MSVRNLKIFPCCICRRPVNGRFVCNVLAADDVVNLTSLNSKKEKR